MIYSIEPKMNVEEMGDYNNAEVIRYSKDFLGTNKVKLVKDIENDLFCYNYALNDKTIEGSDEGFEQLECFYNQIPIEQVKRWDIVSYHQLYLSDIKPDLWNCKHFGKILKSDGTLAGTIIRSKWGRTGIFDTPLDLVCSHYGNKVIFWRKKEKTNEN